MASQFSEQEYPRGKVCFDTIGELNEATPLILAELKSHARDLRRKGRDKDNRILLCFPPRDLMHYHIGALAVSPPSDTQLTYIAPPRKHLVG